MRVLLTCRPLTGHYEPLTGLAAALARAGHAVGVASGRPVAERARAAGFDGLPVGPEQSLVSVVADRLPPPEVLATDAGRAFFFVEVFAGLELEPRAADLERALGTWRPDVLVHEVAELAGPLCAAAAGLPYATASYGPLPARSVLAAAGEATAPHWRRRGLDPGRYAGALRHLYLDCCPPSLQLPWIDEVPAVQRLRPAAADGAPSIDDPVASRTVYVTFGTVWNRDAALVRSIVDVLAGEELDVVVTTGGAFEPSALGAPRDGVRVEGFIPQAHVLARCAAVVCHGGAGTVLGALAHGRPLLVVPQGADQFGNAGRVVAAGAGRALGPGEATEGAIRDAVRALLGEPSYRRAAAAVAAEIAAMPAPEEAIGALGALLAQPPPRRSAR